ncbi:MAG TPA: Gfo/Idh/MocA family oxidoreductase [Acidimicrobiia bacterium]|nr:Gfo/Idh/MocA family oxidoreductase [Acidimicrobiia bacterium]
MLRLGLVGCGSIARAHAVALRLLAADGHARLVAVADPDATAIDGIEQIAGPVARHYTEGAELIRDPEVDAVVVVAPTRFHRDLIAAVAAAGKPLFTEKPLAPSFPVVEEIVDLVERAGIPAQVGFQSRFHPINRFLHRAVHEGRYGEAMGYVIRDDQFWPTGSVIEGHTSWRSEATEAGGGALLEHSIHSCDLACWLFGPVRRVYARTRHMFGYDVEDTAALTIEHESGVVGTLLTIFNGVEDREERRLEVFFERAAIEATTDFVVDAPEDSLLVKEVRGPAERIDTVALCRDTFAADGVDTERPFYVYQYLAHRAFVHAVTTGVAPTPGVRDALAAHRVVEAAYRSSATNEGHATAALT